MDKNLRVRCPNCGSFAKRRFFSSVQLTHLSKCLDNQLTQTECPVCDYLMLICARNGAVIEAYAPGIPKQIIDKQFNYVHEITDNGITAISVSEDIYEADDSFIKITAPSYTV